ncbi:MAG: ROK family protein [Rhodothermales bacterium]|nr:ROK family protein [Rhodothermales bacterium]
MRDLVGGIEAGGTKIVCGVGTIGSAGLIDREEIPTSDNPEAVLEQVGSWLLDRESKHGKLAALGIASFGPVDLKTTSPQYGHITSTPKPRWTDTDIVGLVKKQFPDAAIGFDTDVNGAALGEHRYGAARGLNDFVYITMGTGIGAGGMSGGILLHGLVHPEMGHLLVPRIHGDEFAGSCKYHGACWEGLCSGPAIAARTGTAATDLPADSPVWNMIARYSAAAIANIIFTLSPERIIIGGSVRKGGKLGEAKFFESLRRETRKVLSDYIASSSLDVNGINSYITPPVLGNDAGIVGALVLAEDALRLNRR